MHSNCWYIGICSSFSLPWFLRDHWHYLHRSCLHWLFAPILLIRSFEDETFCKLGRFVTPNSRSEFFRLFYSRLFFLMVVWDTTRSIRIISLDPPIKSEPSILFNPNRWYILAFRSHSLSPHSILTTRSHYLVSTRSQPLIQFYLPSLNPNHWSHLDGT